MGDPMAKEYWYFIAGALIVLLPALLFVTVKKLHLLDARPDRIITYVSGRGQAMDLHVFKARNTENNIAPALLLFHGGAWMLGAPRDMHRHCNFFAAKGIHCFSAAYRLGPDSGPDVEGAIDDARAAFDYLLNNAVALTIDPARIAVGGGSAGGHLAAALGAGLPLNRKDLEAKRPAALVLYNPMVDLSPCTPDHHLVAGFWGSVSPLHHVDATLPPTLLMVGSEDPEVPIATAETFCATAVAAGAFCELVIYEGQTHGFFNKPKYLRLTGERTVEFLSGQGLL